MFHSRKDEVVKVKAKAVPDDAMPKKDIPQAGAAENTVIVDGRVLEIRPTK